MLEVPAAMVAQLQSLLRTMGRTADPCDEGNAELPLIFDVRDSRVVGLSRGGVYKAIKRLLHHCSAGMPEPQRQALQAASPRRLSRHRDRAQAPSMHASGDATDHLRA